MSIKLARTFISATLALFFTVGPVFPLALQADAARSAPQWEPAGWVSAESTQAVEWLTQNIPTPGIGDELTLLAMIRAEHPGVEIASEAYVAAAQSAPAGDAETAALRALALAACGQTALARQGGLLASLGDAATLLSANDTSAVLALILFGYARAPAPESMDTAALARGLSGTQNEDGSFSGNVRGTARTLSALAYYTAGDEMISASVNNGTAWLATQQASFGGFEENGAISAAATAEVVLALAAMGVDGLENDAPSPAQALLNFQREDGGFAPDLDSPSDVELSALCTLACIAGDRYKAGLPWVLDFGDIPQSEDTAPSTSSQAQAGNTAQPLDFLNQIPGLVLPGVGTVPGILVLATLALLVILLIAAMIAYFKTRSKLLAERTLEDALYDGNKQPTTGKKPKDLSSFTSTANTRHLPARKKRKLKKDGDSQTYIYTSGRDNHK